MGTFFQQTMTYGEWQAHKLVMEKDLAQRRLKDLHERRALCGTTSAIVMPTASVMGIVRNSTTLAFFPAGYLCALLPTLATHVPLTTRATRLASTSFGANTQTSTTTTSETTHREAVKEAFIAGWNLSTPAYLPEEAYDKWK